MKTLEEYINEGKELIADWQWAYICLDKKLMEKIVQKRIRLEQEVMMHDDDFVCAYYHGIYQ